MLKTRRRQKRKKRRKRLPLGLALSARPIRVVFLLCLTSVPVGRRLESGSRGKNIRLLVGDDGRARLKCTVGLLASCPCLVFSLFLMVDVFLSLSATEDGKGKVVTRVFFSLHEHRRGQVHF